MALTAGTLWEIRFGGNDLNGTGFYDRDPGTSVDYTQQNAAQADFTNLTTAGAAATTLTDGDAGGKFTAAMAGNLIYIASGANFTTGYYEIITFTDTDNVVLDRTPTPGGAGADGEGKVGGGRATITDAFLEGVTAGDFIYLESGTYAIGAALTILKDGTAIAPITLDGYFTTRGDDPFDTRRPLIQDGGNALDWFNGSFWIFKNLRFECSNTNGFRTGPDSVVRNCKSSQSEVYDANAGFYINSRNIVLDCEAENTNGGAGNQGRGIYLFGGDSKVFGCYIHDNKYGILVNTGNQVILFSIIDCGDELGGVGIDLSTQNRCTVAYNTIYDCATGIENISGGGHFIFGNIINSCATGASWTTESRNNVFDYNNWFGNTVDTNNFTKGEGASAVDPQFTTPGSNFSLQSGSACIDAAFILRLGVG